MSAIDYTKTKKPLPKDRSEIIEAESVIEEHWQPNPRVTPLIQHKCVFCHRTYRNKDSALGHVYKVHILNAPPTRPEVGEENATDTY